MAPLGTPIRVPSTQLPGQVRHVVPLVQQDGWREASVATRTCSGRVTASLHVRVCTLHTTSRHGTHTTQHATNHTHHHAHKGRRCYKHCTYVRKYTLYITSSPSLPLALPVSFVPVCPGHLHSSSTPFPPCLFSTTNRHRLQCGAHTNVFTANDLHSHDCPPTPTHPHTHACMHTGIHTYPLHTLIDTCPPTHTPHTHTHTCHPHTHTTHTHTLDTLLFLPPSATQTYPGDPYPQKGCQHWCSPGGCQEGRGTVNNNYNNNNSYNNNSNNNNNNYVRCYVRDYVQHLKHNLENKEFACSTEQLLHVCCIH